MSNHLSEDVLLRSAEEAFQAIEKNTGVLYWTRENGLQAAVTAFNSLSEKHGLGWLIDAAIGTGMSHAGLALWLDEAIAHLQ